MLIRILFPFKKYQVRPEATLSGEGDLSLKSLPAPIPPQSRKPKPSKVPQRMSLFLALLITTSVGGESQQGVQHQSLALKQATVSKSATALDQQSRRAVPAIAPSPGWQMVRRSSSIVAYLAPKAETPVAVPPLTTSLSDSIADPFNGTRHPYLTDVKFADLTPVAPGRYAWSATWQGEGYDRILDRRGHLVSPREGGADIYLSLTWDTTVTDPAQPNLIVTIQSNQDRTAQLTNLSAFHADPETGQMIRKDFGQLPPIYTVTLNRNDGLMDKQTKVLNPMGTVSFHADPETGQMIRKDFGQLPPIYTVTLNRNDGLMDKQTKVLNPMGTVSFAYHMQFGRPEDLSIRLEAVNQLFNERMKEIAALKAAGWTVKEVPAPGYADKYADKYADAV